jgi:hypothetical protein
MLISGMENALIGFSNVECVYAWLKVISVDSFKLLLFMWFLIVNFGCMNVV